MILHAPGPTATPEMKKKLATAINFHTSFQMCINHIPLWGLVDLDKEVELVRIEDDDGDVQEVVKITVRQVLFRHQLNHLPLWQSLLQNDDGSWRGYYSNGKGCHNRKGVTTSWSGSFAAHLKFHLLKWGVTEESTLKLIRASCSTHSLHNAITSIYKDGKIVSAAQAEMDNKLEEMAKRASWVDITVGMETSERREYESKHNGMIQLLNPSNPRALNFANEQSMKTFSSKASGTAYTVGGQESLGDTAYRPIDDDIDSQESDLFEGYENNGFVEDPFYDKDEGIIANMDLLKGNRPNMVAAEGAKGDHKDKGDMEDEDMADNKAPKFSSPEKITRKATNFAEILPVPPAGQQEVIQNMLQEWVETHGSDPLPPLLQNLAH